MDTPTVVFEDQDMMVIEKPAGWISTDTSTAKDAKTVQRWLAENYNFPIFSNPACRNGIVHRLDKETSGIMLVAKNEASFAALQAQFKERTVKKTYVALVHDKTPPEGTVTATVGRLPWNRERFGVFAGGRDSETDFVATGYYQKDGFDYTLVTLTPKTGRTHQIRIHMKYLHHPLVSDPFYGGRKMARKDRVWCPRLFLHAASISFLHPTTKSPLAFESKLPEDLSKAFATLTKI